MNVVVDSSAWIAFFRGDPRVELESALAEGRVVVPPVVVAELLSGVKTAKENARLRAMLAELPIHETPRSHWEEVGALRRALARSGFSVSIPDAHVARCAIETKAILLSDDKVFAKIAKSCGLTVHGRRPPT